MGQVSGPSPEYLATALTSCMQFCPNFTWPGGGAAWGRLEYTSFGKLEERAPSMWLWGQIIHAGFRFFTHIPARNSLTFALSVKPKKLFSPAGTLVKLLYLSSSLGL